MNPPSPSASPEGWSSAELRRKSKAELIAAGDASLRQRLVEQATYGRDKYGPLAPERLGALLADPVCARYPTRLLFELGDMASYQFAQPALDPQNQEPGARLLYLRPPLQDRPDLVLLAVAYMLPALNYGPIITDEHCLLYGATLLGLRPEEFYRQICELADFAGSEARYSQAPQAP